MAEDIMKSIDAKLEVIIRLLSSTLIQGRNKTEAILDLGSLGLENNLIASIVGTTRNAVGACLSEAKKKSSKREAGKKGKAL